MKLILKFAVCVLWAMILFFISCKKEYSCEGCAGNNTNKPPISNKTPISIAGPDQVITLPTNSVSLNGSSSNDPDGIISEWLWTKISGPASFTISRPRDSITNVKDLVAGIYQFEFKVTDNDGLSAKDTIQIIVDLVFTTNHPPIANAGADQTITLPTNTVNLNGSGSTDPDNNITRYSWTKISGPTSFNIIRSTGVQTHVTNLVEGIYLFELIVTDAGGLISKDTLNVCVFNIFIGQEIIYNGVWGCNDLCRDGDVYWDSSPYKCNPYADSSIALQVSIRLDTSSVWINVCKYNSPLPPVNQFYWQVNRGYLWVSAYEGRLIGTPVTVRVKFL